MIGGSGKRLASFWGVWPLSFVICDAAKTAETWLKQPLPNLTRPTLATNPFHSDAKTSNFLRRYAIQHTLWFQPRAAGPPDHLPCPDDAAIPSLALSPNRTRLCCLDGNVTDCLKPCFAATAAHRPTSDTVLSPNVFPLSLFSCATERSTPRPPCRPFHNHFSFPPQGFFSCALLRRLLLADSLSLLGGLPVFLSVTPFTLLFSAGTLL